MPCCLCLLHSPDMAGLETLVTGLPSRGGIDSHTPLNALGSIKALQQFEDGVFCPSEVHSWVAAPSPQCQEPHSRCKEGHAKGILRRVRVQHPGALSKRLQRAGRGAHATTRVWARLEAQAIPVRPYQVAHGAQVRRLRVRAPQDLDAEVNPGQLLRPPLNVVVVAASPSAPLGHDGDSARFELQLRQLLDLLARGGRLQEQQPAVPRPALREATRPLRAAGGALKRRDTLLQRRSAPRGRRPGHGRGRPRRSGGRRLAGGVKPPLGWPEQGGRVNHICWLREEERRRAAGEGALQV
mmetsp:Transcript_17945/g.49529  ORF Transcript_17945/g.49529 Transcript_17945/m.49529 type:complete len:297 (+) Transcript_17945:194-1084(+)